MGRNVAFAWGGYMVNLVSGFLIPRMISDELGQSTLGVWDLSWSIVAYFGLVQLGMGGSISRYVAHYRSLSDTDGLNRSVSTIAVFQRSVGILALILAAVSASWILPLFENQLGDRIDAAGWVLIILGIEVAATISLSAYGAVISGCHRWDFHNGISAFSYGLVTLGMIAALLLGGGLPSIALVHAVVMVGADLVRKRVVSRVCPELRIHRRGFSATMFREQALYSIKSLIPSVSNLLANQALALLIAGFMGPSVLAVFARSRSLMSALRTLAAKFGMIVVPTASALQAVNDRRALRDTLLTTTSFISFIALPILTTIALLGDHIIRIWMGDAYVKPGLLPILCLGTYASLVQEPVWSVLAGMNAHGRIALAKLAAAAGSALMLAFGLWRLEWGILSAAVSFVLPQIAVDGLATPWHACRVLECPMRQFLIHVMVRPLGCAMPSIIGISTAAATLESQPVPAAIAMFAGMAVSFWCYVRWLLPKPFRPGSSGLSALP